jgi:surfeit locus 1 family protein
VTVSERRTGSRFWLLTAATVLGVLMTASLGQWQLSRAAQKAAYQALLDERSELPPLDVAALAQSGSGAAEQLASLVHRSVVLQGHWVAEHTVYVDNRQMNGRPGFYVMTPLRLLGHPHAVVLVQRGWAPRNFQNRSQLPPVATDPGALVRVEGRVAAPPSRLYEFSGSEAGQGSSRIRQNLDLAAFRTETGLALADFTVVQTGSASEGLKRDWPVISSGVDKHYGYAFQWFGLSSLMAVLYVWFQIIRRFVRPRSKPAA